MISDRPLSSCSLYYWSHQRSKHNEESLSIPIKDIELFYCLIGRLLITSNITRPNVQDCVISLLTTMELPMNYHKNRNLNADLLFKKKIRMLVLSSTEDRNNHSKILFNEHKNYILIILQQIIQLRRFKKVSTVLIGVFMNMIKWLDSSLYINLTKYTTDHQEHTTNNARRAKNELINGGVKTANIQYYNTNQKLILSNIVTGRDIYNNYSYTSCVNWEIEKTSEAHLKKL